MLSGLVSCPLSAASNCPAWSSAPALKAQLAADLASDAGSLLWPLGVLSGLMIAAFGALSAASLIGYSPARLGQFLEEAARPDRVARTTEIDRRDSEYLAVAFLYQALGWTLSAWSLLHTLGGDDWIWALPTFVVLMAGIAGSLPAALAQARPERSLLSVLPALRAGWYPLRWPLVLPLLSVLRLVQHLLRWQPATAADTAEMQKQVLAAVADTVTTATLPDTERKWIGNIVGLKDLPVSKVMTPRPDIVAFPEAMALGEAVRKALEHGFSRYPVFRDRIDEVVGIFNVKDALVLLQPEGLQATTPLRAMLREALFVPETTGAAQLLRRCQAKNQHMAVVIDEYGTTVGLVTVEDLLEEIVGDIGDEYDAPATAAVDGERIRVIEAGRVLELPARATVREVNELLDTALAEDGDWETVAGMVLSHTNRIPAIGEVVIVDGVEFRVLQADERRINSLRATLLAPQPAEGAG